MQDFNSMLDLLDEVQDQVERQVQGMRRVTALELGLDPRCGRAYVDEDCIVVEGDGRSFNYYGGFEYIDESDVRRVGDYVIYLATADRVMECLECLMEKDGLCESEDAE